MGKAYLSLGSNVEPERHLRVAVDALRERFGEVQGEYQQLGGYELEARAREVLAGLGFREEQVEGDVGALSGGWRMRAQLCARRHNVWGIARQMVATALNKGGCSRVPKHGRTTIKRARTHTHMSL